MPEMTRDEARERFAQARSATLATADEVARPHLVPVVFALDGDVLLFAVDHKPKRSQRLKRLANIRANPSVALLTDAYDEDWERLWWARADGTATIHDDGTDRRPAIRALTARYPQYEEMPPRGPVVVIAVSGWSDWSAS